MKLPERYMAPVLRVEDVVEDGEWVKQNFRRFLEFFYFEYPTWKYMVETTPENYKLVAKSKGLPVFKVGLVNGSKLKLKKYESVRIVYVDDGEVVIPLYIIDGEDFIVV